MNTTPQWETELESEINAQIDRIRLFSKQGNLEEALSDLSRFGKERIASGFASTLSLALQQERKRMVNEVNAILKHYCVQRTVDGQQECKCTEVFDKVVSLKSLDQPKKE